MDDEERSPVGAVRTNGSPGAPKKGGNWGPRGISVSADEDMIDQTQQREGELGAKADGSVGFVEEDSSEDEIWSSAQNTNNKLDNENMHR